MNVLGINAVFHDPAAALVVDGTIVAAAEEERFSRRKHGKEPVPFSTWELPVQAARWCLEQAGLEPSQVDAVAYSYDPREAPGPSTDLTDRGWEGLRTLYAARAPRFLETALPGLRGDRVRFVGHHLAHAASTWLAAPAASSAVLVVDGRGERWSTLGGHAIGTTFEPLFRQALPHSLGLLYEDLTEHLGFRRSSDEYKVMALAAYGKPRHLAQLRDRIRTTPGGGLICEPIDWDGFAPAPPTSDALGPRHADLASSVQRRLEEVLLELCEELHRRTGERTLTLAGGVALNCVANSELWRESPFDEVWVQPAAGDSGTALGAALLTAAELGDVPQPMRTAALGRAWSDEALVDIAARARVPATQPDDIADTVAQALADGSFVAWFQGAAEFGPRALGHRSLLADPRDAGNLERLNDVKGREQFRPVAPLVLAERAADIFEGGPLPSPYMLFTHRVRPQWRDRIPAAVHIDGTARVQTVDAADEPLLARMLRHFEARTGVPVVINTSLNTAGRPIVDSPQDALECFGSAPIDLLALGPLCIRRGALFGETRGTAGSTRLEVVR